jgi:hypothetical protein
MVDPKMVKSITGARESGTAISVACLADPGNGLVGAKVCRTTQKVHRYRWKTGQETYDSFWFPSDPAFGLSHNTSRVCAVIPTGTVVVIGARRDQNSPHGEMVTQWYVSDTKKGTRTRPPYGWRVQLFA